MATDWRAMTDLERRAALAVAPSRVTYLPGSHHKRLAYSLVRQAAQPAEITPRQAAALWGLVWRYRRQIADVDLIEHARRLTVPDVSGAFLQ